MSHRLRGLCVVLALLATCAYSASAQQPMARTEQSSKLATLMVAKGVVVQKDFYPVGAIGVAGVGSLTINAVVISVAGDAVPTVKGLRIEATEAGSPQRTSVALIDMDQLAGFNRALGFLSSPESETQPTPPPGNNVWGLPHRETGYTAGGDFSLNCFKSGKDGRQMCSAQCGSTVPVSVPLSTDQVAALKRSVESAIGMLSKAPV